MPDLQGYMYMLTYICQVTHWCLVTSCSWRLPLMLQCSVSPYSAVTCPAPPPVFRWSFLMSLITEFNFKGVGNPHQWLFSSSVITFSYIVNEGKGDHQQMMDANVNTHPSYSGQTPSKAPTFQFKQENSNYIIIMAYLP